MQIDQKEYLTTKELASYLGVSQPWLEAGRANGFGPPFIRTRKGKGSVVRYKRSSVDAWMLARERTPEAVNV